MKTKLTLIIASLIISFNGFSQSFAPVGAKWIYSHNDGTTGHLIVQEVIKDTIIEGKTTQKLFSYYINKNTPPNQFNQTYYDTTNIHYEYVYKQNDTIFTVTNFGNIPIYIFSSEVNDTITIADGSLCTDQFKYYCNQFEYKVIGIDTIQIQGMSLRELEVIPVNNSVWFYDITMLETQSRKFIENIGSEDYFFGRSRQFITLEGPIIKLLCYQDDQINYTSPNYTGDCTFSYLTSINNEDKKTVFQLFPNPTTDFVHLQLENTENVNYRITDITGKVIVQNTWNGQAISVENLNSGVYFMTLLNKNEIVGTQKIIKR